MSYRILKDPTGGLRLHATLGLHLTTVLSGHDQDGAHLWSVDTAALPARVILAAAAAATGGDPGNAARSLRQAGWARRPLLPGEPTWSQYWSSPDRARAAAWLPPDDPFEHGGWSVRRADRLNQDGIWLEADAETPDAVIAALALTD